MRSLAKIATVDSSHRFFAVLTGTSRDLIFTTQQDLSVREYLAAVISPLSPAMALGEKASHETSREDEQKRAA